jgi:hypothetical protein
MLYLRHFLRDENTRSTPYWPALRSDLLRCAVQGHSAAEAIVELTKLTVGSAYPGPSTVKMLLEEGADPTDQGRSGYLLMRYGAMSPWGLYLQSFPGSNRETLDQKRSNLSRFIRDGADANQDAQVSTRHGFMTIAYGIDYWTQHNAPFILALAGLNNYSSQPYLRLTRWQVRYGPEQKFTPSIAEGLVAYFLENTMKQTAAWSKGWFAPLQQFEDDEGRINLALSAVVDGTVVEISPEAVKVAILDRRVKDNFAEWGEEGDDDQYNSSEEGDLNED